MSSYAYCPTLICSVPWASLREGEQGEHPPKKTQKKFTKDKEQFTPQPTMRIDRRKNPNIR